MSGRLPVLGVAMLVASAAWWSPEPTVARPRSGAKGSPAQALVRADFRVAGTSCAACLMRVEKVLSTQRGVLKVGISIFEPFPAVVVYDRSRIRLQDLESAVAREERLVRFVEVTEKSIAVVPAVLVPEKVGSASGQ